MEDRPQGIPSSERIWTRTEHNGKTYYTTTKGSDRSIYFLYEVKNGNAVKIDKDPSPRKLDERNVVR